MADLLWCIKPYDLELLAEYQEFETPEKVGLGDGYTVDALGIGNIHLRNLLCIKSCVYYRLQAS